MPQIQPFCTPPDQKNLDCLAVVRVSPVVCAHLDCSSNETFSAICRDVELQLAAVPRGPAGGDTAPAAGVDFSADPHGNHGDSKTQTTAGGVL